MQSHPLIFCITFCISIGLIFFPLNPQYTFRSVPHSSHFSKADVEWLSRKQEELIDAAMTCPHSGKRRMILNLICQQPAADPPRVDFLDFCMERMISREEPPGVQSLCMKLAYQLTRSIPELQQELRTILEIMEPDLLVPAIRSVRKNTLKAMKAKKNR